ncbi:MAG: MBL fold metallo-hydrolase [Lachnospiraceae bacterium]|nr:MBL fold metallo-hydrolase [Lachnospiraceae bacterium]
MAKGGLWNTGRALFLSAALCLGFFSGCGPERETGHGAEAAVKVTFFDVGKGDAVLIETANHCMMIDSGYDDTADVILDYLRERETDRLDYLLLSHFDKDHVGGADRILEEVETGTVLQPDYQSDGGQYGEYMEVMRAQGKAPAVVTQTMELSLDGVEFVIYPPQKKDYEEEDNDFSLVVRMRYGDGSFLFAGDCEKERLNELLEQREFELASDVLKVPHHGRKEKNSREFLSAVRPGTAVITSSKEKPADEEICGILEELGTDVYFTENGTVTVCWDGEKFEVLQE